MSIHITIDSLRNVHPDQIQSIISKMGNSVSSYMLREGSIFDDLYFDFNVNQFENGYKLIKSTDQLINQDCSICIDKLLPGEYKRELKCSHVFHKKCIDKWTKSEFSCPVCRSKDL
jgi:hypothetical protein